MLACIMTKRRSIVKDAYIVTLVFKSPSLMLGVSSYNEMLTFKVGYCEPEIIKR